ncbi:MAG TPA: phosphoglycerate dehydrogenase [Bacillota bacterium]|nr:phosphoglycerate dehydrogenase [Bacillota bacterium]
MPKTVLVTPRTFGQIDAVPFEMLKNAKCKVIRNPYGRTLTEDELIQIIPEIDGVILGLDPLSKKVLERAQHLKVISKYGAGLNNIDIDYATNKGIVVANTPGANSTAVAELTIGLLISASRHICTSDRGIRQGTWNKYVGMQLKGKTLGVVGAGHIGREVAERAMGLKMNVICCDILEDRKWADSVGVVYVPLPELLSQSDYITVHVPLTEETHHLISHDQFETVKSSAILVNTSRGGIVDEEALYSALATKKLAGAALDVFEEEPPTKSPLVELDNVVLTSHIGAHTREAVENMGRRAVSNLLDVFDGRMPKGIVNPEVAKIKSL